MGQEKSSRLASCRLFPAIRTMKMNGTTKTTIDTTMATALST